MSVNLSLKGLPENLLAELRRRAAEHNRSPEGEAVAILEASLLRECPLTITGLLAKVRDTGLRTPSEAAAIIRGDRDARGRR